MNCTEWTKQQIVYTLDNKNDKRICQHTLSDIRSLSWMRRAKKEFGSRERVVLVVKKQVPPTFSRTHWLLPCFVSIFGLFLGFKFTVDIMPFRLMILICGKQYHKNEQFSLMRDVSTNKITHTIQNIVVASIDAPYHFCNKFSRILWHLGHLWWQMRNELSSALSLQWLLGRAQFMGFVTKNSDSVSCMWHLSLIFFQGFFANRYDFQCEIYIFFKFSLTDLNRMSDKNGTLSLNVKHMESHP